MPSPLTATHRLEFQYTVDGVLHKSHAYCHAIPSTLSDPTGFDLERRVPLTPIGAAAAIDAFWTNLNNIMASAQTSFGVTVLQVRAGTVFNPIAFRNTPVTPSQTGTYVKAAQVTVTFRGEDFSHLRVDILESLLIPGQHVAAIPTTGMEGGWMAGYDPLRAVAADPYNWQMSRNQQFISGAGGFVALTTDLNDKIRRRRGIA